ncbi:unnamed protein product, partial [Symbiodinium microadriaticum]
MRCACPELQPPAGDFSSLPRAAPWIRAVINQAWRGSRLAQASLLAIRNLKYRPVKASQACGCFREPVPSAYNPEVLVPLLRAAEQLPLRPGQGSVTLEECMEPVYLSAANRPIELPSSQCLGSLLGLSAALALRK